MGQPVIFVSTCEFSGDMHGEVLVRELQKLLPEAILYGIGGPRMAAAGVELLFDPTRVSTIGFLEALRNLRRMKKLVREITEEWNKRRPDLMLWLDSGGFNLVLAKAAKERQIPVYCMFSPSAWAYGQDRAVKLAERVKLLLAVAPFEADFYRKFGATVTYVGHPLLDRVRNTRQPQEVREALGVADPQQLVVLMPGSRKQEIAKLLRLMLEAAAEVAGELRVRFALPVAASLDREWLESIVREYPVECSLCEGGAYDLLAAADGAVIASGTATLEAAILGAPMIIVYRISGLSYQIYKAMETAEHKKLGFIGLPNLMMGRSVVPELLQKNLTAANIARELKRMLTDAEYNAQLRRELGEVRERIGPPGVMQRAAQLIAADYRD
ncbi:lipid-A-disaccharide synthase [Hydrogenispora ethanolica]|uniref:Lipid-A-disaccharide synthase n=1 Tax=Hydrogenispora ethanolica TaxID=1082276 RepID=A0A4V2QG18_HYDET|nr:lipid-A-disaccharide synthase [Hydrogenispora ethanolica]TCL74137.1 lipid-A-disaccharide synthase [Hydrogenispora ethanolica]